MRIPETGIEVDLFTNNRATCYALTHYHADHRKGLKEGDTRPIICSTITRNLLAGLHDIPETCISTIDPGEELALPGDITVRAYDANHCPGALMFLFTVNGKKHLHTGDFRYCAGHDAHPELFESIDTLFIDATYKSDEGAYDHPSQEEAIEEILRLIRDNPEKTVYIGLYQIGKNKIIQAIHEQLQMKVYVNQERKYLYSLMGMAEAVTTDPRRSRVKGYAMSYFHHYFKMRYPDFQKDSMVIIPTGWSLGKENGEGYYYVPYSEHNSSGELKRFIEKVNPRRIIETNT